jgi:type IV pilus assembly protein PilC
MTDNARASQPMISADAIESFAFRATTAGGESLSGTVDAASIETAEHSLVQLGLLTSEIKRAGKPRTRWPLSGNDFQAFNQQIAQLTAAGMPVEFGLRLIARDMQRGRLAEAIKSVAADLECGKSLPESIAAHRASFPPLYGPLMEAGISAGRLSDVLMNLGLHITFVQRMRSALWRAMSYPTIVLVMLLAVFYFICLSVIPPVEATMQGFHVELPLLTNFVFAIADAVRSPVFLGIFGVLLLAGLGFILWVRMLPAGRAAHERLAINLPIIGRPLRLSLAARWCSAAVLGLDAGLDLSRAIALAGAAVGSTEVARDSVAMQEVLDSGNRLSGGTRVRVLPHTIPAAIGMAAAGGNLPQTLRTLAQMYEHQAEVTVEAVRVYLSLFLMLLAGAMVTITVFVVVAPLVALIQTISSPMRH